MKIALVKKRYSLQHGGSERYCVNLSRQLKRHGHEVTIIGEHIDEELAHEVDFRKVSVNRLTSWTHNRSFAENAGQVAKEGPFDLVYGLGRSFGLDAVRVTERLQTGPGATVAEIRDLLGTTRKFAVPLCEYLDRVAVTKREGDLRVLAQAVTVKI